MQGKRTGDLPFFKVGDISQAWLQNRHWLTAANHYLTNSEANSINAKPLPQQTTVFAKIGAAIALNRRAILAEPSIVDNNVMGVHPSLEALHPRLLFYFMWTVRLGDTSRATTVPSVRKSDVENLPIPLPPLSEQHRIVAEIEKHFTRLDASVDALKRAQANLKRYRASLLKVACEGRLVPTEAELARSEDRDYEPADRLLERILYERRDHWESQPKRRGKYKEPAPPDTSDLPELPEGWVWTSVEHLSYLVQYGTSAKASSSSVGTPVLRMGNIQDGKLDFSNLKYLPNGNPEVKKTLLNPGDLLFNRTNSAELVGKSTVFKGELPAVCFASYLIRVSFEDSYLSDLACTYINSEHGRNFIRSVVSQQVGQANVNGTKLSSMPIPLPPLAEQHRIVAEVERQMSVIQQAEAAVDASLKGSDRLRQSILKQAFSGQLVPQDPNDEPASVLLERIRAEREASQAKPKRPAPRRPLPDTPSRHDISSFPVLSSPVMLQSASL